MIKEIWEKPKAKLVLFDLEEVYMLDLWSKSEGEDDMFPQGVDDGEDSGDDWDV